MMSLCPLKYALALSFPRTFPVLTEEGTISIWSQAVKVISAILGSAMALEIAYVFEKQILS